MARAIWTGMLSFGLVNVPVGLYSATEDKTIHFNQFQVGTTDRIRTQTGQRAHRRRGRIRRRSSRAMTSAAGEYVIVTPEELESVEPGPSRTIEIIDFVDLDDIDPIYYKATYYLGPQGKTPSGPTAAAPGHGADQEGRHRHLRHALQAAPRGRPARGSRCWRSRPCTSPTRSVTRSRRSTACSRTTTFKGRELDTAKLLVDSMSAEWDPANYTDTYRERVEELIDRKRQGEAVVTDAASREPSPALDLMQALQKSVEAARSHRAGNRAPTPLVLSSAPTAPRRGPGRGDELGDLSKAELYERATQLEIPGRSKMSRVELQDAVRAATSPPARRRKAS